jgi:hypothetical protein
MGNGLDAFKTFAHRFLSTRNAVGAKATGKRLYQNCQIQPTLCLDLLDNAQWDREIHEPELPGEHWGRILSFNDKMRPQCLMSDSGEENSAKQIIIYVCSGCSDVGELADRTPRVLSQKQIGEMSCLAGIGGRVKPLIRKAEKAEAIMAIDGCPLNCARHTLSEAGF